MVKAKPARAIGRISSAEGGYVVRGARTGKIVPSRSSQQPSMVGLPRTGERDAPTDRLRVRPIGFGWVALCPCCKWAYLDDALPKVHTGAMRHACPR